MRQDKRHLARILTFASIIVALAAAQNVRADYLPSIKIGTAALISPTAANTYYGSSTVSSDGLYALTNVATPVPTEIVELARALKNNPDLIYQYVRNNVQTVWMYGLQKGALGAEIDKSGTPFDQVELMIALLRQAGYSANYVSSTISVTPAQFTAATNISLARAACQLLANGGIPATVEGQSNVTCSTFSPTAQLTQNVEMAHIWVQVTIPGSSCTSQVCAFDPSFKTYTWKAGIPLASAMGFTSGDPLLKAMSGATTGTDSGVSYVKSLKTTATGGLNPLLQGYGTSLLNYIKTNNLQGAQMEDIVSGSVITPDNSTLRQSTLPYAGSGPTHIWTPTTGYNAIPDQYRTTLTVDGTMLAYYHTTLDPNCTAVPGTPDEEWCSMFVVTATSLAPTFFADEIYGRRLMVDTDFTQAGIGTQPTDQHNYYPTKLTLKFDGNAFANIPTYTNTYPGTGVTTRGLPAYITLTANHPYAASSDPSQTTTTGDYMDASLKKPVGTVTPIAVVHGWGDVSQALFKKWSDEVASDNELPNRIYPPICIPSDQEPCDQLYHQPTGDFARQKAGAAWLGQMTRAAQLNGALANTVPQIHHMLGFVYADAQVMHAYQPNPQKEDIVMNDSFDRIDIDGGISFTSRTADSTHRNAAVLAFAASSATLEGSIPAQFSDLPDTSSTATRFEWGNSPPVDSKQNPQLLTAEKFYQFNTTTQAAQAVNLVTAEGYLMAACPTGSGHDGTQNWTQQPELSTADCLSWGNNLANDIVSYAQNGFTITASQDGFLGPGQRGGGVIPGPTNPGSIIPTNYTFWPSKQRGGAFVATKYSNGDPVEIAHIILGMNGATFQGQRIVTKGGGAGNESDTQKNYDPSEAADILKSRFVDRSNALGVNLSNGSLAYTSPVSLSVGSGGFPYELTASLTWQPGTPPNLDFGPISSNAPQPGWKMNWLNDLEMSGSGFDAMGASDIRSAIGAIVAFYAAQDIYVSASTPQRDAAATLAMAWWSHQLSGNVINVSLGADTRQFDKIFDGTWILPGDGYATVAQTGDRTPTEGICTGIGANPPYSGARGWDYSNMSFDVTNQHGDVESFDYWQNPYSTDGYSSCGLLRGFRLTEWTFPYGMTITPHYVPQSGWDILTDVSNSVGRKITISPAYTNGLSGADARSIQVSTAAGTTSMTDAAGKTTKFTYTGPFAQSDTQRPIPYPLLYQVTTPEAPTKLHTQYDYDSEGRIKDVQDAVALQVGSRGPFYFYVADGTRGERDDPIPQSYTVVYDTYGHPSRYIDEMGFETDALFDSRSLPLQYIYPEGDCDILAYDNQNNTTDQWSVDRSSACNKNAGPTHVHHESAAWNATWNKPISVTNARGFTTTLEYFATGLAGASLLKKATRPAIAEGQPIYQYTYTGIGKLDTTISPTTSTTNITTKNNYDASANLMSTIVDYVTGQLNLTTTYGYDANGDRTSTTDPNGNLTDSCFDLDRRKTEDHHHDGGIGAAILAAEKTDYDAIGRDTVDYRAKTVTGITTCGTGLGWISVKTTTYTPNSKVATVKDADGRITSNTWDDVDRLSVITDPLTRKIHYIYCAPTDANCAANQVKTEYHAWSTGSSCAVSGKLQQCYRRETYWPDGEEKSVEDANGNLTQYTYDDFIRLTNTAFPDASYEQLTLDENGNMIAKRTRSGQTLTYQFNAIDWMTTKCMPSVGQPVCAPPTNPGTTTNWAYLLDGRVDALTDNAGSGNIIDYGYDTAGRQNGVTTTMPTLAGAQTVSYSLDANGNRTKLQWPDGFYVGYCYDNLNRMTVVMKNSTDVNCDTAKFATYTYDPMSRRQTVTYGNGQGMTYDYTDATDLTTLNHTIAGISSPNYTFTYTNAHELQTEAITDSNYLWQPGPNSTDTYTAANNLNQYPSWTPQGGSPANFGYDGNGNLTAGMIAGGPWTFLYDAENRLLNADKTVGGTVHAAYAYDPLGRRTHKSGTGTTETFFLNDGTDEILDYNSAGTTTRRLVPGPAIDETIVQGTGTGLGTYRYYHTNHQGSVIALTGSSGTVASGPYVYDPNGNCTLNGGACSTASNLAFTGRVLDAETGLYYYRARYYSSVLGRFLQTDPVGYKADLNLYTYVGNDPTDKTDPSGQIVLSLGGSAEAYYIVGGGGGAGVYWDTETGHIGTYESVEVGTGVALSAGGTFGVSQSMRTFEGWQTQVRIGAGPVTGQANTPHLTKPPTGASVTYGAGVPFDFTISKSHTSAQCLFFCGNSEKRKPAKSPGRKPSKPVKPIASISPDVVNRPAGRGVPVQPGIAGAGQSGSMQSGTHTCTGSHIGTSEACLSF